MRSILSTNPASTFTNAGADGISRLVAVGERLFVNNIARNYELVTPVAGPDGGLTLRRDAYHDVTSFPGEDIPSQLDLDAHGVFERPDLGALLVYDHHGRIRAFRYPPSSAGPLQQIGEWRMLGDTERVVMARDCFITSSPRGQYSNDPPASGIFVSEPLPALRDAEEPPQTLRQLHAHQALADWGVVTALTVSPDQTHLAVGAAGRVGLFTLAVRGTQLGLNACLWEAAVPCHVQWLALPATGRQVLAGGYSLDANDHNGSSWDAARGGSVMAFGWGGELRQQVAAPDNTAWGYAGNPLTLAPDGTTVYAVDRSAGLHALDLTSGSLHALFRPTAASASLGIGHAALLGGQLYAAYTRGGFRLFGFDLR